jgi:hypothetical protein
MDTDSNLTSKKCWQTDKVKGVSSRGNIGNTMTDIHASSQDGFVISHKSLTYIAVSMKGDYHGQITAVILNFKAFA